MKHSLLKDWAIWQVIFHLSDSLDIFKPLSDTGFKPTIKLRVVNYSSEIFFTHLSAIFFAAFTYRQNLGIYHKFNFWDFQIL